MTSGIGEIFWGREYDYNVSNMPQRVLNLRNDKERIGVNILELIGLSQYIGVET